MKDILNIVVIPCVLYFAIMGVMFCSITSTASSAKVESNSVAPSVAVMTLPSVLQDVTFSDGKAYMFNKPVVFDEGCCQLLSAVFNNDAELPMIATMYTEHEDYVYMQLN